MLLAIKKDAEDIVRGSDENVQKLQRCKQKIDELEKAGLRLQDENQRLGVRAAVGFEELTPRFKGFEETFKELGIERPKPEYRGIDRTSSNGYIKALIQAIRARQSPKRMTTKA